MKTTYHPHHLACRTGITPHSLLQCKIVFQKCVLLYEMQNKKEYAYNQSYARTSAVLPDMGQTENHMSGPMAVDNKQSNTYNKNVS